MPNWCNTAYTVVGDEKDLDALHKTMRELETRKEPSVPNGFGTSWLGCLVDALGDDWNKVHCRGEWGGLEYEGGELTFYTMTAWCPCNEVWELVREKFPSISYYYMAEESGCNVYLTNDANGIYYPERYYVELCTVKGEYCSEYFQSMAEACSYIRENTGCEVATDAEIEELNDKMNEENEEAYCYLHEFKVIE